MSSIKCPKCGLVNFATADVCKRCGESLSKESSQVSDQTPSLDKPSQVPNQTAQSSHSKINPLWILAGIVILIALGLFIN
jgi:uncharacterized membrane protein YvbJ